jgi:mono/diheme cytochrome c family protein
VGRSAVMPAWGEHLTNEQIADVVAYLRKINRRP